MARAEPEPPAGVAAGEQAAWRRAQQRRVCERVPASLLEWFSFIADPRGPAKRNAGGRGGRPVARRVPLPAR